MSHLIDYKVPPLITIDTTRQLKWVVQHWNRLKNCNFMCWIMILTWNLETFSNLNSLTRGFVMDFPNANQWNLSICMYICNMVLFKSDIEKMLYFSHRNVSKRVYPDHRAPTGVLWSGSTLFAPAFYRGLQDLIS